MKIKMELLSDTIFGNGKSIPGQEDISVLTDKNGFPYYKGGSFKGIFREELIRYLSWIGKDNEKYVIVDRLLGNAGNDDIAAGKMVFSDFCLSDDVKNIVIKEIGYNPTVVIDCFTNLRTFTKIEENGVVSAGSLRIARCVNKGITFYSEVMCSEEDKEMIIEVIGLIKWIGTMRNRGFGNVKISVVE